MIRGLYTSALGMTSQMGKMDIISNNIANADTNSYKRDLSITKSFSEELVKKINDDKNFKPLKNKGLSLGVFIDSIYTDFSVGNLKNTGKDTDLAIQGDGFIAVEFIDENSNKLEAYTREGMLNLSNEGYLINSSGKRILGENGYIKIETSKFTIDEEGNIFDDNTFVDKLKIISFTNLNSLRKFKDSLYLKTEDSFEKNFDGKINQGFLEHSNVNTYKEMVDMISLTRTYEANQKMITIHDQILNHIANTLGKKA